MHRGVSDVRARPLLPLVFAGQSEREREGGLHPYSAMCRGDRAMLLKPPHAPAAPPKTWSRNRYTGHADRPS